MRKKKRVVKKSVLNENFLYDNNISERIFKTLEEDLRYGNHSLADCNIFPEGDVISSEMKLIKERFTEVVLRCREALGVETIDYDINKLSHILFNSLSDVISIESDYKTELEELAVKMVMEEFDIPEDTVVFEAKLVDKVDLIKASKKSSPELAEDEFESHDEIVLANKNVKKRRAINAMIQGSAKKVNHIFHMVHDDLVKMNPKLTGLYKIMMSVGDYMYYIAPDLKLSVTAGLSEVETNHKKGDKPTIKAEAICFPVLIHELVKGAMEVLSLHGLPSEKNVAKFVIDKADFLAAEPWDMRLGPPIWGRFCDAIPAEDINLKYHIFTDITMMSPDEFNNTMKEIIAKTKKGKFIVSSIIKDIKNELKNDDFNESMGDSHFDIEDLL